MATNYSCDGPNCARTWRKLPKRGLVLSTGKGKRYRFCTLRCLEEALLAGLGNRWYEPPGRRDFKAAYWREHIKRCSTPPWKDWPFAYEEALRDLAALRDTIKPGRLDRMLAATMKEIRKAARKLNPKPKPAPYHSARYQRYLHP